MYRFLGTNIATGGFGTNGVAAQAYATTMQRSIARQRETARRMALIRSAFRRPVHGFGMDVPYVDKWARHETANVQAKSPDCGSAKATQQMLNDLGYAAGAVDGVFGSGTFGALGRFAKDHGIAYGGTYPNANLCSALMLAWNTHQTAASSVTPAGANVVAQAAAAAAQAAPVVIATYTASLGAGTQPKVEPEAAPAAQPSTAMTTTGTAPLGFVDKMKAWWTGANNTKKAMVVGGIGLAIVLVAAMSLRAPLRPVPMKANRKTVSRRRRATRVRCSLCRRRGYRDNMSKKDYIRAAAAVAALPPRQRRAMAEQLASMFAADNPRFDRGRFMAAAGVTGYTRNARSRRWQQEMEENEMRALLRSAGYDPSAARGLQAEGMGPFELKERLRERGGLTRTHNLRKYGCNGCGCQAPVSVGRVVANAGRPLQRLTWQYWTGQKGDTTVLADRAREMADYLARAGATNIRVSAPFTANARAASVVPRSKLTHAFYYVTWHDEHGHHSTVVKKRNVPAWLKYVAREHPKAKKINVQPMGAQQGPRRRRARR